MHDDRSIVSSPNPASGAPPPKHKPIGRALFWAFLPCFLWLPLTVLFQSVLAFGAISQLWPVPVVIASVILYPSCLRKRSRVFRAFMALVAGAALLCCAWVSWAVIILIWLKLTGGGAPFPT